MNVTNEKSGLSWPVNCRDRYLKCSIYLLFEITWLSWLNIGIKWSKWKIVIQICCELDSRCLRFWPCSKCSIRRLSKYFRPFPGRLIFEIVKPFNLKLILHFAFSFTFFENFSNSKTLFIINNDLITSTCRFELLWASCECNSELLSSSAVTFESL